MKKLTVLLRRMVIGILWVGVMGMLPVYYVFLMIGFIFFSLILGIAIVGEKINSTIRRKQNVASH